MKHLKDIKDWQEMINEIVCGDCLEGMKLMPDKSVDLVVTDIPYNISQEHGGLRDIDYGEWDKNITIDSVLIWINEMIRISRNGLYVCCADQQFSYIFNECLKHDLITRKFEWLKPNPNIMNGQCFWLSSGELVVCAKTRNGIYNGNCEKAYKVIQAPRDRQHPTQKPIELLLRFIEISSNKNDLILDPFMGSWTTARACKDLGRNFIGFEISEKYCKIGEERLRQEVLF